MPWDSVEGKCDASSHSVGSPGAEGPRFHTKIRCHSGAPQSLLVSGDPYVSLIIFDVAS